ncbi:MAG: hypothetical protein EP298_06700 [Gammaproteobacteria bacterium]|nr:MAG: hypothetical protein EP298_06700 [Gammaproteobacteria bacterium]UTW42616.1 hypothetical protein KFE69_00255 [bacterium SCSIO 12844]
MRSYTKGVDITEANFNQQKPKSPHNEIQDENRFHILKRIDEGGKPKYEKSYSLKQSFKDELAQTSMLFYTQGQRQNQQDLVADVDTSLPSR